MTGAVTGAAPKQREKMDNFSSLVLFSLSMFLGAFLSGYVPLSFSISASRLRSTTIFGAGLLVGTALIVIIPEGVAMHYEAQEKHAALTMAASLSVPPGVAIVPAPAASAALGGAEGGHGHAHDVEITHEHPGHWQIGAALAFGFAFQLIVGALSARACRQLHAPRARSPRPPPCLSDRLSGELHGHGSGGAKPVAAVPSASAAGDTVVELNVRANTGGDHSAKGKSAMMGMVVHAAIDGVALGAAVREGDAALGWLVFLAIILHKFPSSFGLSSYLLHHGISHDGVKKRLLVFSSAAPLGALATYAILSADIFTFKQEMLALCLLFSGGTFLYVATAHVLPEIQSGGHSHGELKSEEDEVCVDGAAAPGGSHAHGEGGHTSVARPRTPPKMRWREVAILVTGILLPLLAPVHHGH